jgi:hypothetical protein
MSISKPEGPLSIIRKHQQAGSAIIVSKNEKMVHIAVRMMSAIYDRDTNGDRT